MTVVELRDKTLSDVLRVFHIYLAPLWTSRRPCGKLFCVGSLNPNQFVFTHVGTFPVFNQYYEDTVKPVLSGHSKRRQKWFQDRLWLNAGQKHCRMHQESIQQYFQPSLSYHLSLRPLFFLLRVVA